MAIDLKKIIAQKEAENFISYLEKSTGQAVVSEHRFDPSRRWRFDFAIPAHKIAIEIDGGVWLKGGGRHNRPKGYINDIEKINKATALGWLILKFIPGDKYKQSTIDIIRETIINRKNGRY